MWFLFPFPVYQAGTGREGVCAGHERRKRCNCETPPAASDQKTNGSSDRPGGQLVYGGRRGWESPEEVLGISYDITSSRVGRAHNVHQGLFWGVLGCWGTVLPAIWNELRKDAVLTVLERLDPQSSPFPGTGWHPSTVVSNHRGQPVQMLYTRQYCNYL